MNLDLGSLETCCDWFKSRKLRNRCGVGLVSGSHDRCPAFLEDDWEDESTSNGDAPFPFSRFSMHLQSADVQRSSFLYY